MKRSARHIWCNPSSCVIGGSHLAEASCRFWAPVFWAPTSFDRAAHSSPAFSYLSLQDPTPAWCSTSFPTPSLPLSLLPQLLTRGLQRILDLSLVDSLFCHLSVPTCFVQYHGSSCHAYPEGSERAVSNPDISPGLRIYRHLFVISIWVSTNHLKLNMSQTEFPTPPKPETLSSPYHLAAILVWGLHMNLIQTFALPVLIIVHPVSPPIVWVLCLREN